MVVLILSDGGDVAGIHNVYVLCADGVFFGVVSVAAVCRCGVVFVFCCMSQHRLAFHMRHALQFGIGSFACRFPVLISLVVDSLVCWAGTWHLVVGHGMPHVVDAIDGLGVAAFGHLLSGELTPAAIA